MIAAVTDHNFTKMVLRYNARMAVPLIFQRVPFQTKTYWAAAHAS